MSSPANRGGEGEDDPDDGRLGPECCAAGGGDSGEAEEEASKCSAVLVE